ncbi:MAG: hypothetical protein M3422_05815 [Actinomycetota bacterium]|nr:hypothetical protein [Actinomycetota bacterium]
MSEPEDPARRFLDQTVPKHDEWEGREPEDGPARPRHVQHPADPLAPLTARERRATTIRNVAWGVGPTAAFAAGAALSDDDPEPEQPELDPGFGEAGSGF